MSPITQYNAKQFTPTTTGGRYERRGRCSPRVQYSSQSRKRERTQAENETARDKRAGERIGGCTYVCTGIVPLKQDDARLRFCSNGASGVVPLI